MADKNKYNGLEKVLNHINSKYISLKDEDVKRNNRILGKVLTTFVEKMKEKDPLFKAMFSRVFYGGSYYDGLRVGKPEEFDLDLLLSIPKYAEPVLTTSNVRGFVHLKLQKYDGFMKQPETLPSYKNLINLLDDDRFLSTQKVLAWMERIVGRTLNDFPLIECKRILQNEEGSFEVSVHKGGPAMTLKILGVGVKMDVDLVACFIFGNDMWPKNGFKPNPVQFKPNFFIVPKPLKTTVDGQASRYWRLSFQEQERVLIDNKITLKPTIKLLKKLRDNMGHKCIASYYIKTAVLHIADTKSDDFWKNPLSYVFMTVLCEYKNFIENAKIPYYWNKNNNIKRRRPRPESSIKVGRVKSGRPTFITNNNLIGSINRQILGNIANRLQAMINDIDRNISEPNTVAKYLLDSMEYNEFISSN